MLTLRQLKPRLSLEPLSFYHALCTLLIVIAAYALANWEETTQGGCLILASLFLSQAGIRAEENWQAIWQTSFYLLWGLIAALVTAILSLAGSLFILSFLLLLLVVFAMTTLGWKQKQYFVASFSVSILAILAAYSPANLETAQERFYLIMQAAILVFVFRALLWFYENDRKLYFTRVNYFQKLQAVYRLIFYTSSEDDGLLRPELEESHFQGAWSDCLAAMQGYKKALARTPRGQQLIAQLERIWDLSLSLGSLRYRLTEFAVFSMGEKELHELSLALMKILQELAYFNKAKTRLSLHAFEKGIKEFETLYQSMLQAVAKEPLVILLFIQDLYALKEALEQLGTSMKGRRP